ARDEAVKAFGKRMGQSGWTYEHDLRLRIKEAPEAEAAGLRALANALLPPLLKGSDGDAETIVQTRYDDATNMTDRLAALQTLALSGVGDASLADFYDRYRKYPLVIDKWFNVNAAIAGAGALERVKRLTQHPDFTLKTPNRARALLGAYAASNLSGFHRADGAAYAFYCQQLAEMDALNPQASARMLTLMDTWTMLAAPYRDSARAAMQDLSAQSGLSVDLREMLERSLK
ncbi:MAG: aminopeptidase N C-terminal domain-containing protein, partial [Pseudomonadota bacterium]